MKNVKMFTVLVLGLMVSLATVGKAAPMGTAWTYQGRLLDANGPADGLYDFEFKLFDDPCTGTQQGSAIDINDLDVIDGSFKLELDFGPDIFTGYAHWLETAIRPGDSNDVNDFITLRPRQELTPTPYAIYAQTAGSDSDWMVSGSNMYAIPSGNVGIGTTNPDEKLQVNGDLKVTGAYKGNIGPNNGAPFPRPAYNSGWQNITGGGNETLIHNIGGDPNNYVVDLQQKTAGGIHNYGLGGIYVGGVSGLNGFCYGNLTGTTINIHNYWEDATHIRVRIWVYN